MLRSGLWLSVFACGLAAVMVIAGCGTSDDGTSDDGTPDAPRAETAPGVQMIPAPTGGPGVGRPEAQTNCTRRASDARGMQLALSGASPGDRICLTGDMNDTRLEIGRSGTSEAPIVILGGGTTRTAGITVEADNVVVDGVAARQPHAPGISIRGTNITVRNSTSISPRGGDGDGIRFWGNNIKILHNTISDTRGRDEKHADCMQTFATTDKLGPSNNVLIDGNRCEKIDNICLIAEGPDSKAGDGTGEGNSANFVVSNNYCESGAGQAFYFDDIENVTVTGNEIVGELDKAFAFTNDSFGARVSRNKIDPAVGYEVGMDDSSERGYRGPRPGGGP